MRKLLCLCLCLLTCFAATAQTTAAGTVAGTVSDANGEPIIGANIIVKDSPVTTATRNKTVVTTAGTITDFDGNFSLSVPPNATLIFSYIGFVSKEVPVNNQATLSVTLLEDFHSLDEVVVVGYGVQKKRDLTGAVTSVKLDDAPTATFASVSHALAGKAAGLRVSQNSAQVGGGASFRIRGETSTGAGNDPLIIIDGFPISNSSSLGSGNRYSAGSSDNILESINPSDIQSIEILKDASATAIYGSRAGHGVIIVTTKRGAKGKSLQVNYSANFSIQSMKNGYQMLDAQGFMSHWNDVLHEDYLRKNGLDIYADYIETASNPNPFTPRFSDEKIANAKTTDWFNEVTRTGLQQSHNVSLAGGSESTQYLASINYFSQQGVIQNNAMDRLTSNFNLDQTISRFVKAGLSFNLSRNQYDNVPLGDAEWENAGVITSAVMYSPYIPVYDDNGDFSVSPELPQTPNPVSLLEITDKTIKDRLLASAYLQAEPIKGLTFKASLGVDRKFAKRKNYIPTSTMYGAAANGVAFISQEDKNDYLLDLTANFSKAFKLHNLALLAGYSYQQFNNEGFAAGNYDFPIDGFLYNNLGAGASPKPDVSSWASKSALGSYFGRINYSFDGKYLFTATLRADGASNFNPDYRWGFFPSASLGWRFSDEEFLAPLTNFLSNGKLRAGYGQTGNSNVGNRILDTYGVADANYAFGNTGASAIEVKQLGNPKLTWETTSELNLGIDLGFFNNRINASIEYYNRIISDLLVSSKSLLSYHEITSIAANIGKTQGQGFELTLNTVNLTSKLLTWTSDISLATYNDRWLERDPEWKPAAYQSANDPIRSIFLYRADGLLQPGEAAPDHQPALLPGQIKIINVADEEASPNVLNQYDRFFLGTSDPDFTFGFNNSIHFKNFDLNIYLYGEVGRWRSGSYYENWTAGSAGNQLRNLAVSSLNSFSSTNLSSSIPSTIPSSYRTQSNASDFWYQKVSFVRCRNITLGYTLPLPKYIAKQVRIYADVNNPFVLTNWNGVDPETDSGAYSYPNVTAFSFGIDIAF
ncbi:MAG: TonB-dependent receptor [Tannerellaceae bacterium]|jgi:TonB-linked SusC/RagA family outer membrane protein|nr:TonB-dependent receptor [Tannerellaceae bacterium]